jgi:O-methyltransferase involved in polyketide biosynthesis
METGRASRTALRVAQRRAIHQILDRPPVLNDPVAVPLLGPQFTFDQAREAHPIARALPRLMAARSRYAEDHLAYAVAHEVAQYVSSARGSTPLPIAIRFRRCGSSRSTFLPRKNGSAQCWPQQESPCPKPLTFVPLDFEHNTLAEGLGDGGFDFSRPAFFGWLGVVPYLTLEAFPSTLETIAALPPGTAVSFDYGLARESLSLLRRMAFDALARRVAAAGEPFQLFFTPDQLESELRRAGFQRTSSAMGTCSTRLYFSGRAMDSSYLTGPGHAGHRLGVTAATPGKRGKIVMHPFVRLAAACGGCGYHTLGAATHLPPDVKTLAVPVFATRTEANGTETA